VRLRTAPTGRDIREKLSKHLMKIFIEGKKDEHRLTVHGLSYLRHLNQELNPRLPLPSDLRHQRQDLRRVVERFSIGCVLIRPVGADFVRYWPPFVRRRRRHEPARHIFRYRYDADSLSIGALKTHTKAVLKNQAQTVFCLD
jgi:hypothetical protein